MAKQNWRKLFSRKTIAVFLHGISSGLPLGLTGALLQGWMAREGVSLTTIGLFSLIGQPYTYKFLWAPVMDRYMPPLFGRRRGWIFVAQVFLVFSIMALGASDPKNSPWLTAAFALLVAFFSATQDIVIDAYRTEALEPREMGFGASLYVGGYRVGFSFLSLALGFYLTSDSVGLTWSATYMVMGAAMSIGILGTLIAPEPEIEIKRPDSLSIAIVQPFIEFFKRSGAVEILLFIILYRLTDTIGTALFTAFLVQLGFTNEALAAVKAYSWIPSIAGTVLGGLVIFKIGLYRSLWAFGILAAVSNVMYLWLASRGPFIPLLHATVLVDNICGGVATAAFTAFMMTTVNKKFTATQYALLTSFMALGRVYLSAPAGWVAERVGWETYFLISIFLAVPGLLMLLRFKRWTLGVSQQEV